MLIAGFISLILLGSSCSGGSTNADHSASSQLTEDEKHRLYSAALAASESPLDSEVFKDVCRKIGVFDAYGQPNDKYMAFVSQHVDWGMKPENSEFHHRIETKEMAHEYIARHLP